MNWAIPAALYAVMVGLLVFRMRLVSIALLGILFSTTWMVVSSAYLDSHPGVYAEELFRRIGGGWSCLRLVTIYGALVAGFLVVFTNSRLKRLRGLVAEAGAMDIRINRLSIYTLGNIALGLFVIGLYIKLSMGPIPLLTGMDRVTYKVEHNHALLAILYKYCSFISFFTGVLVLYQIRNGRRLGRNITVATYVLILVYFVLIGNKFSTPFFSLCMFLIPLGMLAMVPRGCGQCSDKARGVPIMAALAVIITVGILGMGLSRYYAGFGAPSHVKERLIQRVGVKQAQLWWATNKKVCEEGQWSPLEAATGVFISTPFDNRGNTALLYLICRHVGERRAAFLLNEGYLYTGAFPAILLELVGPIGVYAAMFLISLMLATLLYLMYRAIALYHYPTIFFLAFVLQPFVFLLLGGNLFFAVKITYALKVCLALVALAYDNRHLLPSTPSAEQGSGTSKNATV